MDKRIVLLSILCLILGLVSVLFTEYGLLIESIRYLGVLTMVHALLCFYLSGGQLITPTGIYMISSALLGGFASVLMLMDTQYRIVYGHWVAIFVIFLAQIFVALVSRHYVPKYPNLVRLKIDEDAFAKRFGYDVASERSLKLWSTGLGLTMLIVAFAGSLTMRSLEYLFQDMTYAGIIVLVTGQLKSGGYRLRVRDLLLAALLFLFYYFREFEGFGRINLVSLLIAIGLSLNYKFKTKRLKRIILFGFFPSIAVGSLLRGGSLESIASGMGSMVSPLYRFGELVEMYLRGDLNLFYGKTLWAALVSPVPRALWENKPWNFNREITYIFARKYVPYGHSEASVLYAEWFFNFGFLGILIGIVLMGWFLRKLDTAYFRIADHRVWSKHEFIVFLLILLVASGLLDLFWGGFSTFAARSGFRLILLSVFLLADKVRSSFRLR